MDVEDEVIEAVKSNNTAAVSIVVGIVALAVGAGVGYILGKRKKNKFVHAVPAQKEWHITDESEHEVVPKEDKAKDFIANKLGIDPEDVTLAVSSEEDVAVLDDDEVQTIQSIFEDADDDWDPVVEKKLREYEVYVLKRDEFFADENGWPQHQATYYAGDDIMTDPEDQVIFNYTSVFGDLKFGHGSGDPNVFYVRNEKIEAEYEVVRHSGYFSVEVHGLEIENNARVNELKHSDRPKRFRMD